MYKIILPFRYFIKRRISYLAVAAVALCVFIVVVVMTVMTGLVVNFKQKNHDYVGDCIVSTDSLVGFAYYEDFLSELDRQDFVSATSAVIKGVGFFTQSGASWNEGVEIVGIDPEKHSGVTNFGKTIFYHQDNPARAFVPDYEPDSPGCIIGIDVPKLPGSRDRQGQYYHSERMPNYELLISCFPLTAKGALAKAGTDLVNTKAFYFSDDSHSGLVKVDGRTIYIPIEQAKKLFEMAGQNPRINAIHIKFARDISLNAGCERVAEVWKNFTAARKGQKYAHLLENVSVQSWLNYRKGTIAPMEKEHTMFILLFMMLAVITVFIIAVVFYMIISHKSKDIGILKSLGVSNANVLSVFLCFAMMIGVAGGAIGTAAGCGFLMKINDLEGWLFDKFDWQLWDRSVYAIGDIPNDIQWHLLTIIIASAIVTCLAGALLPSLQAARRQPAEILQVNQL